MRQRRILIHSCLITAYLPGERCQPCEAPQRGYGVDHVLQADKMIAKQERIRVLQAAAFESRACGSVADARLPFLKSRAAGS